MKKKISQGEIFGIALMFVVIIIGIIIYSQISAINNIENENLQRENEYKILAEGTLNTILKTSTGCNVEFNKDSLKDVINYCLENQYSGADPQISCSNSIESACNYTIEIINKSLMKLYNSSDIIGHIPYELKMDIPENQNSLLANITFTNFGKYKYKNNIINKTNRWDYNFKRAPSGLITWSTSQREIEFELYLYYR